MPAAIQRFELLMILSIILGIVGSYLTWDFALAQIEEAGMDGQTLLIISGVITAIWLALILFTSRGASNVAKWIVVVLVGLGALASLPTLPMSIEMMGSLAYIGLVQIVLQIVAVVFLFTSEGSAWFNRG